MDIRTGKTYATREEALAAGVPSSDIAEVTGQLRRDDAGLAKLPTVRFRGGPFTNCRYKRTTSGNLVRVW